MIVPALRIFNSGKRLSVAAASAGLLLTAATLTAQQLPPFATEEQKTAAVVQPPALPVGAPVAPGPMPVAPPLPGQLNATPLPSLPPVPPPGPFVLPALPKRALTPAPSVPSGSSKVTSSTSTSGQFIVHGDELQLRSAFSARCEEVATSLRQLLNDKEPWVLPIVIALKTAEAAKAPGPAVSFSIAQITHGGFHLQVNVKLRPDLRPSDFRNELVRLLLAERIVRNQSELTANRTILPDWLLTGTIEALDFRQRARPSTLFAAIFKSGKIYGIEEIIEASPVEMDALSKTIYQTSCCALVLALLDQPEGRFRFGKFLNALAADPRTERELLNHWFPGFAASPASLNKWWSLQLASLASPSMAEPLSAAETLRQLDAALVLHYQANPSEIPKPRQVAAAASRPAPVSPSQPAAPTADVAENSALPEVDGIDQEEKVPWLRRLNPFARRRTSDDAISAAIAEAAKAEAASRIADGPPPAEADQSLGDIPPPESEPVVQGGRQPLLNRLFGRAGRDGGGDRENGSDEDESSALPEPKPAPEQPPVKRPNPEQRSASAVPSTDPKAEASKEQPAATGTKTENIDGRKWPSLNPLKWFRRDDKRADEEAGPELETPAANDEVKKAAVDEPGIENGTVQSGASGGWSPFELALFSLSPLAADLYATAGIPRALEPRQVEGFLGLKFGKKKEEEPPAGETATPAPEPVKTAPPPDSKSGKSKAAVEPIPEVPKPEDIAAPESAPTTRAPRKIKPLFGSRRNYSAETRAETAPPEPGLPPAPKPQSAPPPVQPKPKKQRVPSNESPVAAAVPIEDYAAIMKRADRQEILSRNINALASLQNRAGVLFRSIIADYNEILSELAQGKIKDTDTRLRALRTRSAQAVEKTKAVRDALDVYEANESPAYSGKFDDYLMLPETIQKELPERGDPISKYLDALEKEFSPE